MPSKGWTALRNRAERGPSAQFIKLKPGQSAKIHFLVKTEDDVVFFRQHYLQGTGYRLCEDETDDLTGNCKYCDNDSRPGDMYAFNVLDRDDGKVKILQLAASHAQNVLEFLDEYESLIDRDYRVKRTGTESSTRYTFVPTKEIAKWDAVEKKAYAERYNLEEQYDANKKNPKVDTTAKKKRVTDETKSSPPKASKKSKAVEDDDDEEPVITKSKKKKAPVEDDDE